MANIQQSTTPRQINIKPYTEGWFATVLITLYVVYSFQHKLQGMLTGKEKNFMKKKASIRNKLSMAWIFKLSDRVFEQLWLICLSVLKAKVDNIQEQVGNAKQREGKI